MGYPCYAIGYIIKKRVKNNTALWKGITELLLALIFVITAFFERKYLTETEVYVSSILATFCFMLFFDFVGKVHKPARFEEFENRFSNFFYKWIGAHGSYFIFVFHFVSATIISLLKISGFLYPLLAYLLTFSLYETFFLLFKLFKYLKRKTETKNLAQKT